MTMPDLLLCPGVPSTAGGADLRCRLCIRLVSRWPAQTLQRTAVAREPLYDPSALRDGVCASLILGHPDECEP